MYVYRLYTLESSVYFSNLLCVTLVLRCCRLEFPSGIIEVTYLYLSEKVSRNESGASGHLNISYGQNSMLSCFVIPLIVKLKIKQKEILLLEKYRWNNCYYHCETNNITLQTDAIRNMNQHRYNKI